MEAFIKRSSLIFPVLITFFLGRYYWDDGGKEIHKEKVELQFSEAQNDKKNLPKPIEPSFVPTKDRNKVAKKTELKNKNLDVIIKSNGQEIFQTVFNEHFWRNISKDELNKLINVIETSL